MLSIPLHFLILAEYKIFHALIKIALSLLLDGLLWVLFMIAGLVWLDFLGLSFGTYCGLGLVYSLTAARRWVRHCPQLRSYAVLPALIPCYFIFWKSDAELFFGMDDCLILPLCWFISRFLLSRQIQHSQGFLTQQKNRIFLIALQGIYGLCIQAYFPLFLERLEWTIHPSFKPKALYPSKDYDVKLYYDDIHEAEKIDVLLPEIIKILKTSPFFQESTRLTLCQKNDFTHPYQKNDHNDDHTLGHYHPWKRYSYVYISSQKQLAESVYNSAIAHELTHQMVHKFYGEWPLLMKSIPLWKDEGYAEYMASQTNPILPSELRNLIDTDPEVAQRLSSPFSPDLDKSQYVYEDYRAALIQARYALDYKKISPLDFMKPTYTLASTQEIMDWLINENLGSV